MIPIERKIARQHPQLTGLPHFAMRRIAPILTLAACLISVTAGADQDPATGKLLVATDEVRGEIFARTVILLLDYDQEGAMGLVVNRPTEVEPAEILTDPEAMSNYNGTLYWGGPVQMSSLRALLRSDTPPGGAVTIVGHVHLVPFDDELANSPMDPTSLRLFIGYAGWAPGQLDRELALGSWHVIPATEELVFADDPAAIWDRLKPVEKYRVAVD
ncbi:MAG: YqgE/AlgH family protein [Woeseiaceae bacterium]